MSLEVTLFYFINNLAGQSPFLDSVFIFFATSLLLVIWIVFVVFLVVSINDRHTQVARQLSEIKIVNIRLFVCALFSSVIAYGISQVIGLLYFRARPFVVLEHVMQLVTKSEFDKSFPSDHTTLAFVLAFSVFWYDKKWGSVFLGLAFLVGISRVYVGVHYPLDILGGIVLAGLVSWLIAKFLLNRKD